MQNSRRLMALVVFSLVISGILLTRVVATRMTVVPASASVHSDVSSLPPWTADQEKAGDPKPASTPTKPVAKGPVDYSKFNHADHDGDVRKLVSSGTMKLDCTYCHLVDDSDKLQAGFGEFPCETPDGAKALAKTRMVKHSACIDCHKPQFVGAGAKQAMCLICHTKFGFQRGLPVRNFPNEAGQSEFDVEFPHSKHKKYVKFVLNQSPAAVQIASLAGLPSGGSNPVRTTVATVAADSNFACAACHSVETAGVFAARPDHRSCFVCHSEKVEKRYEAAQSEPYATNCAGCHPKMQAKPYAAAHQIQFQIASAKTEAGALRFRHDSDHAILQQIPGTQDILTCVHCHGEISDAVARVKFDADFPKLKARDEKKAPDKQLYKDITEYSDFLVSKYPQSCGGCHSLKKKPLIVGWLSGSNKFGNIFSVSDCDRCHAQDIIDKDINYHKKQLNPPKKTE